MRKKSIITFVLASAIALSLAGCGSTDAAEVEDEEILSEIEEDTEAESEVSVAEATDAQAVETDASSDASSSEESNIPDKVNVVPPLKKFKLTEDAEIYSEPSTDSKPISEYSAGSTVEVSEYSDGWYKFSDKEGGGYISASVLTSAE